MLYIVKRGAITDLLHNLKTDINRKVLLPHSKTVHHDGPLGKPQLIIHAAKLQLLNTLRSQIISAEAAALLTRDVRGTSYTTNSLPKK